MSSISDSASTRHPSTRYITQTSSSTTWGDALIAWIEATIARGMPAVTSANDMICAPMMISRIIALVRSVSSRLRRITSNVSPPYSPAITTAPTAPMPAASVGVMIPA